MPKVELLKEELPYDMNEELELLRTNIQFSGADKKVLLLTSAFSGEGKSTIALNLCRSFTELGKTVVLIDADMRNSGITRMITGEAPEFGLSHYLSNQCSMNDAFCSTNISGLSLIAGGKVPPNPSELLARSSMGRLIEACRKVADYIIIDCPPLGLVVDAAVVSSYCDGSMILIESGAIKYRMAQEVVAKMSNTGCPILGVILNKVDYANGGKYYGKYYGKYGRYGKYGKYGGKYGKYYKGYGQEQK